MSFPKYFIVILLELSFCDTNQSLKATVSQLYPNFVLKHILINIMPNHTNQKSNLYINFNIKPTNGKTEPPKVNFHKELPRINPLMKTHSSCTS